MRPIESPVNSHQFNDVASSITPFCKLFDSMQYVIRDCWNHFPSKRFSGTISWSNQIPMQKDQLIWVIQHVGKHCRQAASMHEDVPAAGEFWWLVITLDLSFHETNPSSFWLPVLFFAGKRDGRDQTREEQLDLHHYAKVKRRDRARAYTIPFAFLSLMYTVAVAFAMPTSENRSSDAHARGWLVEW